MKLRLIAAVAGFGCALMSPVQAKEVSAGPPEGVIWPVISGDRAVLANDECAGATSLTCNTTAEVNLTLATANPSDPAYSCRFGAPARGAGTVWFTFVASNSTAHLKTGVVSGAPANDTLLAVYAGGCGGLVEIACNDDINFAGQNFLSELNLTGLSTGATYYVQMAAYDTGNLGTYSLRLDCTPPSNDLCANATALACNSAVNVDLSAATTSAGDPTFTCRYNGAGQGVGTAWYTFTPSGTTARLFTGAVSVPAGRYADTILGVYVGACSSLVQIACNDDINTGSSNFLSELNLVGLTPGLVYHVQIAAYQASAQCTYSLILECPTDCVICPPAGANSVAENEPCGTDTNGGCNSAPPVYQTIPCGTTVCGTGWSDGGGRDTDWFKITLEVPSYVQWCLTHQFDGQGGILSTDCPSPVFYSFDSRPACTQFCTGALLAPGTYVLFDSPQFNPPVPCNDLAQWQGVLTVTAACPGDFNNDGAVNTLDLTKLLQKFGQNVSTCASIDTDHNGTIDTLDLIKLLQRFGQPCPTFRPSEPVAVDPAVISAMFGGGAR